jgi:hypothetical protein
MCSLEKTTFVAENFAHSKVTPPPSTCVTGVAVVAASAYSICDFGSSIFSVPNLRFRNGNVSGRRSDGCETGRARTDCTVLIWSMIGHIDIHSVRIITYPISVRSTIRSGRM